MITGFYRSPTGEIQQIKVEKRESELSRVQYVLRYMPDDEKPGYLKAKMLEYSILQACGKCDKKALEYVMHEIVRLER